MSVNISRLMHKVSTSLEKISNAYVALHNAKWLHRRQCNLLHSFLLTMFLPVAAKRLTYFVSHVRSAHDSFLVTSLNDSQVMKSNTVAGMRLFLMRNLWICFPWMALST